MIQPPHIIREPDPDAEDRAYDEQRQRRLDEETERDEMRDKAQERAVRQAAALLGVQGDAVAEATLRVIYQLGYMDGVLNASREAML